MSTGKVVLNVSQLELGMFVSELDRPWLGTPFLFQGFRIQNIEELERLKTVCGSVYVDIEKSITVNSTTSSKLARTRHVHTLAPGRFRGRDTLAVRIPRGTQQLTMQSPPLLTASESSMASTEASSRRVAEAPGFSKGSD